MSNVYHIGDLHLDHTNIITYENRPFKDTEDMNESIIKSWNNTIKQKDKVFFHGDFAFSNKKRIQYLVSRLNGYKSLIMGNHDRPYKYRWWQFQSGFDEVFQYPIIYKDKYVLSHEPTFIEGLINIHAHTHSNPFNASYFNRPNVKESLFCVSCEPLNYIPLETSEIDKIMTPKPRLSY